MKKSYLIMAKHERHPDPKLLGMVDEGSSRELVEALSDQPTVDWAVAYEFAGDDVKTLAHHERVVL